MCTILLLLSLIIYSDSIQNNHTLEYDHTIKLKENKISTSNRGPFSKFLFLDDYIVNYTTSPGSITNLGE